MDSKWTLENVYQYPIPQQNGMGSPWPPRPDRYAFTDQNRSQTAYLYTPEFLDALKKETEWSPYSDKDEQEFTHAMGDQVFAGGACPICKNDGYWRNRTGVHTGITVSEQQKCYCEVFRRLGQMWNDPKKVPPMYRDVRLKTLVPEPESLKTLRKNLMPEARQARIIQRLKANPGDSYLFTGDAGCGKTHFSMALYFHHLAVWSVAAYRNPARLECPVYRFKANRMLEQHHEWEIMKYGDNTSAPDMTEKKILRLGGEGNPVVLFLDEIDKFSPTAFKLNTLHRLLDALKETNGRVIATSNAGVKELQRRWDQQGDGASLIRRMTDYDSHGHWVAFSKKPIEPEKA